MLDTSLIKKKHLQIILCIFCFYIEINLKIFIFKNNMHDNLKKKF